MSAVNQKASNVVQLPSALNRMSSSDRLMQEWWHIQKTLEGPDKIAALFDWKMKANSHHRLFSE